MSFDPVTLEIMWGRLIAIADEAAACIVRTSFSIGVREANDFACVLMDVGGNSLAENRGSIPSFCCCVGRTTRELLRRFPAETWQPGDVMLTNDPWLGTGHLPDFTVVGPIFYRGRLVGFAASVAHNPDVGGAGFSADCTEVFEEGFCVPPMKILKAGQLNQDLVDMIRMNSRVPDETVGDLMAQVTSCEVMSAGLCELLEDQKLDDIAELSDQLQDRAERGMRDAIRAVPDGIYRSEVTLDGYDEPLKLVCAITIAGDEISVDYTGTSGAVRRGINCVEQYTWAYSVYPLKCVLDPTGPRNEGCFKPINIVVPENSLVNAKFPAPVGGRHLVGHVLSACILLALSDALPGQVIADSGSAPSCRTVYSGNDASGDRFNFTLFANGGMGARPTADGLACTQFPSNTAAGSIEVMENLTSMIVWTKQLLADSGGAGTWRGGDGQEIVIEMGSRPVHLSVLSDRTIYPANGLHGGLPGTPVTLELLNRKGELPRKGRTILEPGDMVRLRFAGGGGYGPPQKRDPELVQRDLRDGRITAAEAEKFRA